MPKIRVNTSRLNAYGAELDGILNRLNDIKERFNLASNNLDWSIKGEAEISSILSKLSNELLLEAESIAGMRYFLRNAALKYDTAENSILGLYSSADNQAGSNEQNDSSSKIFKFIGDILNTIGAAGNTITVIADIVGILSNGKTLDEKNLGELIGNQVSLIDKLVDYISSRDIKDLFGLNRYEAIHITRAAAGWMSRLKDAGKTFVDTLKQELSPTVTGTMGKLKTGLKRAGWVLSLVSNVIDNYDEWKNHTGNINTFDRFLRESCTETVVDIVKGAGLMACVAAGAAAVGVSAPAVVVAGATVVASWSLDKLCETVNNGKNVTETVSDFLIDVDDAVGTTAKKAKKAISNWFNKTTDLISFAFAN